MKWTLIKWTMHFIKIKKTSFNPAFCCVWYLRCWCKLHFLCACMCARVHTDRCLFLIVCNPIRAKPGPLMMYSGVSSSQGQMSAQAAVETAVTASCYSSPSQSVLLSPSLLRADRCHYPSYITRSIMKHRDHFCYAQIPSHSKWLIKDLMCCSDRSPTPF